MNHHSFQQSRFFFDYPLEVQGLVVDAAMSSGCGISNESLPSDFRSSASIYYVRSLGLQSHVCYLAYIARLFRCLGCGKGFFPNTIPSPGGGVGVGGGCVGVALS